MERHDHRVWDPAEQQNQALADLSASCMTRPYFSQVDAKHHRCNLASAHWLDILAETSHGRTACYSCNESTRLFIAYDSICSDSCHDQQSRAAHVHLSYLCSTLQCSNSFSCQYGAESMYHHSQLTSSMIWPSASTSNDPLMPRFEVNTQKLKNQHLLTGSTSRHRRGPRHKSSETDG